MDVPVITSGSTRRSFIRSGAMQQILAFAALVLMFIFFSVASPNFFQVSNFYGILISTAVNGILAIGSTFVIITGGIDLSVGTVMALSGVMTGVFITNMGLPIPLGIIGGMATGALAGVVNGFIISRLKIPPFIATLGMLNVAKGLALVIAQLRPIYFDNAGQFNSIAMGSVIGQASISIASLFGQTIPGINIPNGVIVMFGAALVAGLILSKSVFGRYTFSIGSNEEATRLSGVSVNRWKILVYTVCGMFAGLAGIVISSRINSAQPATGQGYELDAIAAVVIGGTSLSGGEGSILGTIIGAFVISTLANGLRIMSVPQEWQTVITGAIIILAVYLDRLRRK